MTTIFTLQFAIGSLDLGIGAQVDMPHAAIERNQIAGLAGSMDPRNPETEGIPCERPESPHARYFHLPR